MIKEASLVTLLPPPNPHPRAIFAITIFFCDENLKFSNAHIGFAISNRFRVLRPTERCSPNDTTDIFQHRFWKRQMKGCWWWCCRRRMSASKTKIYHLINQFDFERLINKITLLPN